MTITFLSQNDPNSIWSLMLSDMTTTALMRANLTTVDALSAMTLDQLYDVPGVGIMAVTEIWQGLAERGRWFAVNAGPGGVPKTPYEAGVRLTRNQFITLLQVFKGTTETGKELWLDIHPGDLAELVSLDLVDVAEGGEHFTSDKGTYLARTGCFLCQK